MLIKVSSKEEEVLEAEEGASIKKEIKIEVTKEEEEGEEEAKIDGEIKMIISQPQKA